MCMKKILSVAFIILFFISSCPQSWLYAASQAPAYLCEIGLKLYQEGRYTEALQEFKKALMVTPDYEPALRYIEMIKQTGVSEQEEFIPPAFRPSAATSAGATDEYLDLIELQREMIREKQMLAPVAGTPAGVVVAKRKEAKITPPKVFNLDENLAQIKQPIETQQEKSIIITGKNISRYLLTQPNIFEVTRKSANELVLIGKDVGYTYLHVWDDNGRWTAEFLDLYPQPEGLLYEEISRKEQQAARNFKIRFDMDWSSYYTGRRIYNLERASYAWSRNLSITGPTPYGDFDSSASIRTLTTTTDLTYATVGLTNGQFYPFKGFSLRGLDYSPSFYNLVFTGANLRGAMLTSPAFDNKINYTTFWGQEGGGSYGNLSPGLQESQKSYLSGLNLGFSPTTKQNYQFTFSHGWGRDREAYLNPYGYDFLGSWNLGKTDFSYEMANDSQNFANLFKARLDVPKLNLGFEFRDIDKEFVNMTGNGMRQGELGSILNLNYTPTEKLRISSNFNMYRDRLYPALEDIKRWNEEVDFSTAYQFDPKTSVNLTYGFQNDLGRLSQSRNLNAGLGLYKTFRLLTDISTYLTAYHQESTNYSAHSVDYINDRFFGGVRLNLIGGLYYYANKEYNLLDERFYVTTARPNAFETGVDWSGQFWQTPFYGNFRFSFRDEEETVSNIQLLSGEDYIEGYSELSYKPNNNTELYASCRGRNVWADNPTVTKRMEMDFRAGMRYLWDTGFRWDAIGNIDGYVFKDFNGDGLRQRDEPPVEGVKVWVGKEKSQTTGIFGYYKFTGIKAAKAFVTLDTASLPGGFVLTVPLTQEVSMAHYRTTRIDFGIISRSEISGFVFEDTDNNGIYGGADKGVSGVLITLENGKKATTDGSGRYSFPNLATGKHTVSLDLKTLPVYYLPEAAIIKEIELFEGITYIYNIPLKRIKE